MPIFPVWPNSPAFPITRSLFTGAGAWAAALGTITSPAVSRTVEVVRHFLSRERVGETVLRIVFSPRARRPIAGHRAKVGCVRQQWLRAACPVLRTGLGKSLFFLYVRFWQSGYAYGFHS